MPATAISKSGAESNDTHFLDEASARLGVSRRRLEVVVHAARRLSPSEFKVIEELVDLVVAELSQKRRSSLCRSLVSALETLQESQRGDPLAAVDGPLEPNEALESLYRAQQDSREARKDILRDSISVLEAAELTGRSRQALERRRRSGDIVALRRGNRWFYPRWQFDPDAPGGVVPGLADVLRALGTSPVGSAFWLSRPHEELRDKPPITLLHQRRIEPVVALAQEQGHML